MEVEARGYLMAIKNGLKVCARCKDEKFEEEFYKSEINKDGRTCYCKHCLKVERVQRKTKNQVKMEDNHEFQNN